MARATALAVVTFTWALTAQLGLASTEEAGAGGCAAFPDVSNEAETDTSYLQLDRTQRTKEKGQRRNIAIAQEMAESLKNQIGSTPYEKLTPETHRLLDELLDIIRTKILPAIRDDATECQRELTYKYNYVKECNGHMSGVYSQCTSLWSDYESKNSSMAKAQYDDDDCRKSYNDYEKLCKGLHTDEEKSRGYDWRFDARYVYGHCDFGDKDGYDTEKSGSESCEDYQNLKAYVDSIYTGCRSSCAHYGEVGQKLTEYQHLRDEQAKKCAGYRNKYDVEYEETETMYGYIEERLCELGQALRNKCEAEREMGNAVDEATAEGTDRNTDKDRQEEWAAVKRIEGTIYCFQKIGSLEYGSGWIQCRDDFVAGYENQYPEDLILNTFSKEIQELVADIKCDAESFSFTGSYGKTRVIDLDHELQYYGLCGEYEPYETPAPTYRETPPPTPVVYTPPPTWEPYSTTVPHFTTTPRPYTEGPTPYPSEYPTPKPTPYTTPAPTYEPTYVDPTPEPTYKPTPTLPPTYTPEPTGAPTYGPTPRPTYVYTPKPTYNTKYPTPYPTKPPSINPTPAPHPTPRPYVKGVGFVDR